MNSSAEFHPPVSHNAPRERASTLAGQRVVVTGAGGFVGSRLVHRLLYEGCVVVAAVRPGSSTWRLDDCRSRVELVSMDLATADSEHLVRLVKGADVVYHLAAAGVHQGKEGIEDLLQTNIRGTIQLVRSVDTLGAARFVYCGSCFEYGAGTHLVEGASPNPVTDYAVSKLAAWLFVRSFALNHRVNALSLRPFTVYGPYEARGRLVPDTVLHCLEGGVIPLTGGAQTRDFVYVEDVVDAFVAAGQGVVPTGSVFNVCTGRETSVRDLVTEVLRLTGGRATPAFGALPYRDGELWNLSGSPETTASALSWRARTSLQDGLAATIAWIRENATHYADNAA